MLLTNTAEGGTNGVTVSAANSGGASGNPWNTVTATGTLIYSNAQAMHGNLSYSIVTTTSASAFMFWNSTSITISTKVMYSRCYIYFAIEPPFTGRFMQFMNSSAQLIGGVGINVSNQLAIRNSVDAVIATSTTTVPTNAWFRVELYTFSSATVGQVEVKIFLDPHSTTPTETLTTSATENTRGDDIKAALFGLAGGTANADLYMDSMATQETGYLGPVILPTATIAWLTA